MTTEIITRVPDNFDSQPGDVLDNDGHVVIDGEVVDSDTADHSDTQGSQAQEYTSRGARALDIAAKRWESTVLKQRKIDEKLSDALDSGIDTAKKRIIKIGWRCIGAAGFALIGIGKSFNSLADGATKGLNAVGESANDLATGSGLAYEAVRTKYNSARERRKARREAAPKRREDAFLETSYVNTGKHSEALEEQLALEAEHAKKVEEKAQVANERKTVRKTRRRDDWNALKELTGTVAIESWNHTKEKFTSSKTAQLGRSALIFLKRTSSSVRAGAQAAKTTWQETA